MTKFHDTFRMSLSVFVVVICCRSTQADDTFAGATQLYKSGQWQQATAAFDRLAQDPQQDEATRLAAQLYAGESLVQLGQYAEARQRYQFLQHPPYPTRPPARLVAQALFRLGETAWMTGDRGEAAKLLQSFVQQYPLHASVPFAKNYLSEILDRHESEENFAELDEAVGWERAGRHDAALAAYRKLLEKLKSGQVRAETLRRAAKLHDRLAQSRESLQRYQQFLTEFPQSKRTAEVRLAVAHLHDRLDQPAQAANHFREVTTKFPQSPQAAEAAYWLARTSADEGKSDQAMRHIDRLLTRKSLSVDRPQLWGQAMCLKCQLISDQGKWQQVDTLVESAHERLPTGPLKTRLDFWAAEAAFRLRKYDVARARFKTLASRTIGIDEPWTAMVPLRRAQLAARQQLWSEVLNRLDQLERDFPEFELQYEVDYLRGRALAGRGKMTAARRFYRRVIENKQAADTEAPTMAGWMTGETYFHQRDYARARSAYQKVIEQTELVEWQSRAALQAGKCWELEQRWDEAADVYTGALERWPDSASDQELESRLRWAQSQKKSWKQ